MIVAVQRLAQQLVQGLEDTAIAAVRQVKVVEHVSMTDAPVSLHHVFVNAQHLEVIRADVSNMNCAR